jgi:hypothetical protein
MIARFLYTKKVAHKVDQVLQILHIMNQSCRLVTMRRTWTGLENPWGMMASQFTTQCLDGLIFILLIILVKNLILQNTVLARHLSRVGGRGGTPLCIDKQEVGTYMYSLLYTHTGLLG